MLYEQLEKQVQDTFKDEHTENKMGNIEIVLKNILDSNLTPQLQMKLFSYSNMRVSNNKSFTPNFIDIVARHSTLIANINLINHLMKLLDNGISTDEMFKLLSWKSHDHYTYGNLLVNAADDTVIILYLQLLEKLIEKGISHDEMKQYIQSSKLIESYKNHFSNLIAFRINEHPLIKKLDLHLSNVEMSKKNLLMNIKSLPIEKRLVALIQAVSQDKDGHPFFNKMNQQRFITKPSHEKGYLKRSFDELDKTIIQFCMGDAASKQEFEQFGKNKAAFNRHAGNYLASKQDSRFIEKYLKFLQEKLKSKQLSASQVAWVLSLKENNGIHLGRAIAAIQHGNNVNLYFELLQELRAQGLPAIEIFKILIINVDGISVGHQTAALHNDDVMRDYLLLLTELHHDGVPADNMIEHLSSIIKNYGWTIGMYTAIQQTLPVIIQYLDLLALLNTSQRAQKSIQNLTAMESFNKESFLKLLELNKHPIDQAMLLNTMITRQLIPDSLAEDVFERVKRLPEKNKLEIYSFAMQEATLYQEASPWHLYFKHVERNNNILEKIDRELKEIGERVSQTTNEHHEKETKQQPAFNPEYTGVYLKPSAPEEEKSTSDNHLYPVLTPLLDNQSEYDTYQPVQTTDESLSIESSENTIPSLSMVQPLQPTPINDNEITLEELKVYEIQLIQQSQQRQTSPDWFASIFDSSNEKVEVEETEEEKLWKEKRLKVNNVMSQSTTATLMQTMQSTGLTNLIDLDDIANNPVELQKPDSITSTVEENKQDTSHEPKELSTEQLLDKLAKIHVPSGPISAPKSLRFVNNEITEHQPRDENINKKSATLA